jgi:hypothetical protein
VYILLKNVAGKSRKDMKSYKLGLSMFVARYTKINILYNVLISGKVYLATPCSWEVLDVATVFLL